eukprot:Protomagalhaensia_sp_Gyna_25__3974@NODE_357_length_3750_cov_92_457289_g276_i0_p1_GENE_NODE_357_length_3750_cov_92_457289_g276_i0NODE_357_length_3750_cov_92_457289_g276_i0_p1_ORF_typecomplete_len463_score79_97GDI/PF00996_18/9_6e121Amino_oxidase/PF01593_24/1_8e07FAD_oxidored/PF12831_7/0_44FAD_oxidored/PF12831_7/23DAO/PF01266_24/0_24GMC_oxred_N/PF00732_19/0_037_NODE_357_length_3750_cov_92_457289_g276_i022493637
MNEEYDVIVCGTGLKECVLSGLLSTHGKKVLHIDRNPYYGGESASLNLTNLFSKFEPDSKPPTEWGANRDWNVDLIPKFIMTNGKLTRILIKSQVKEYLEFKVVEGTYVYQHQKAGWLTNEKFIHKVPSSDKEALTSSLIPYTEKMRGKIFFAFIANWNRTDSRTWGKFNPDVTPMREVYQYYGLQENTIDFVGHAIALYTNDDYMMQPMGDTMDRLRLYMNSLVRYGTSPFIYPMYGLGTLPEGFSRLSAVYGGTYMLSTPVKTFLYDDSGKVKGIQTESGEVAHAKMVVCDPSYVMGTTKIRLTGKVIRCINILNAPIPNTGDRRSCQIILPQKQLGRQADIYIAEISAAHGVAQQGKYIALVSTTIESEDPLKEIEPALALLGPIEKQFVHISDLYEAMDDGKSDNVYVTNSYDATSHFESATEDCLRIWKNLTGDELDLTLKSKTPSDDVEDKSETAP